MSLIKWIMKDSSTLEDIMQGEWSETKLLEELPRRMANQEIDGFSFINGTYLIYKEAGE